MSEVAAPPDPRSRTRLVWASGIALGVGTYLLSANLLVAIFGLFTLLVLIPGSIAYGITVLLLTRRSKVASWPTQQEVAGKAASRAAAFTTVSQIVTFVITCVLLLTIPAAIIATLVINAHADPSSQYGGSEAFAFYAPLITLSFLAVGFGAPYNFSRSIRAGEAAAIAQGAPAAKLILVARRLNRSALWFFTLAAILLTLSSIIQQVVLYIQLSSYGR